MRFSTRTTYGLRAINRLARNYDRGSLSLPSIAKAENISLSYLERLFSELKKNGLVEAVKGSTGGYKLSRPPKKITVFDVVKTLEGKIILFHCLGEDGKIVCRTKDICGASKVLLKVQQVINKTLRSIKLSDLV